MDFEYAAKRLQKDQSKLRNTKELVLSQKAKKEAEYRRKQQAILKSKREKAKIKAQYMHNYFTSINRAIGSRTLDAHAMIATSIHGDGDKIALPPAILERLTQSINTTDNHNASSPWIFRVGILNPQYQFPASPYIQAMNPPDDQTLTNGNDSDDQQDQLDTRAYLHELSYKYTAYSYATVVEFTQEDGHVGLPRSIANALLDPKRRRKDDLTQIPKTRTRDPAAHNTTAMETDKDMDIHEDTYADADEEKTPGHLAWGAFDIPNTPIEVSMVTLPKGNTCELVPTMSAIKAGFHSLKDIKLVLEQSLVRTRATLSVGDVVHTWHRGVKYDLTVSKVTPDDLDAVSCINTDITVDIGANQEYEEQLKNNAESMANPTPSQGHKLTSETSVGSGATGHKLSDYRPTNSAPASIEKVPVDQLKPEPPASQKAGICIAQIRSNNGTARRRFDVHHATLADLFDFASTLTTLSNFQLVTRFPRRTFQSSKTTLEDAGITVGQEMFMLEEC